MRAALRGVLVGMLLAAAGLAGAQEPGQKAPFLPIPEDWNKKSRSRRGEVEIKSLYEVYRHRTIVLVYFNPRDHRSVKLLPELISLANKYRSRGVLIVWMTRYSEEAVEEVFAELLDEVREEVDQLFYFGINPEQPYRFPVAPLAYIVDKFGRIVYARIDPSEGLEEKIQEVLRRSPTINATPERTKEAFARAGALLREGKPGRAYTLASELEAVFRDVDEETESQIEDLMKQVRAAAQQALTSAEEEIDQGKYESACDVLAELSVRMEDVKAEKEDNKSRRTRRSSSRTRQRRPRGRSTRSEPEPDLKTFAQIKEQVEHDIGRLQSDNYTKTIITKALDNARGQWRNERAAAYAEAGYWYDARELYRSVTEDFPGTDAAQEAQAALDRMKNDPEIRAKIEKLEASDEAARWFELGDRFAKAFLFDQAEAYFRKVLDKYPDSALAEQARARLRQLPEERKQAEAILARRAAAMRRPTPESDTGDED